jgi:hypothetical protein
LTNGGAATRSTSQLTLARQSSTGGGERETVERHERLEIIIAEP